MMYEFNETPITYQMHQYATRNSDLITDIEQDAIDLMHRIECKLENLYDGGRPTDCMLRSLVWCLRAAMIDFEDNDHRIFQHWINELFGSNSFVVEKSVGKILTGYLRLRVF